jgi:RNA polymerase sigma factor (sigma-70 family)
VKDASVVDLVATAATGDERAWAELVRRFGGLVWGTARSFRLSQQDIEDVSQTTWLLLAGHIHRLREPEALPGWLVTTTRRESIRVGQRRRVEIREFEYEQPDLPDRTLAQPDEGLLREELREHVRRSLEKLPEPCQRLLAMLATDPPMSYRAVGLALDMPTGSIGPTRARCLERLRRIARLPGTNGAGGSLRGAEEA